MPIYRNVVVDIPPGGYIEKSDQSVFVKDKNEYDPVRKFNVVKHVIIGRAIDPQKMYPNHNFRMRYPEEYKKASGAKELRSVKRIGMYAVVLSIIEKNSLYRCLYETMGIETANLIVDFCMYSILCHSSIADRFALEMADQLLFSKLLKSGKDISFLFNHEDNIERLEKFKAKWGRACNERGTESVWLAIDGSNNDCASKNADIAERGHAKSKKAVKIVSYLYAVDSKDGTPISFDVYRGGCVDSKSVLKMIGWLNAYQIKVKGVVVDRGFATKEVLEMLDQNEMQYVAMLKGDTNAHNEMLEKYAPVINRKFDYMLDKYNDDGKTDGVKTFLKNDCVMYGISSDEKVKLFSTHSYKAFVTLVFDGRNSEKRQQHWYKTVSNTATELQRELNQGKANVDIPKEFKNCIEVREEGGEKIVIVNHKEVQLSGDRKGFSSLATSVKMDAKESNAIYTLRNSVEEDFAIVKTQLGYGTTGTHSETGIITKIAVGFISSVIRNELLKAARKCNIPTNKIVKELNFISMNLDGSEHYFVGHVENERQKNFMKECGVVPSDLDRIAEAENKRLTSKEPNPFHKFPEHSAERGEKRRGRPKGSVKNSSTNSSENTSPEKKKRGRPKGSKNAPKGKD